jgi:Mg-chelatase subunit ChlD
MRGKGFRQDHRSVSEIYGTVLIISLAFLTALLLVGAGWVIVDQLTTQSQDSLAQDSMRNMDQGIDQIAGSSVNETTTFEFPEGTGSEISIDAKDGVLTLNITTDEDDFWNRTTAEASGWDRTNGTWESHDGPDPVVLGTIRHEAESGGVLAYQGGGLWRKPNPNGTTFIESEPSIDFTGNSLDLGVVNLTRLDAITEGAEVQATKNAEAKTAQKLQAFMAHYWTDRYNPSVGAPVQINLTIESQFADGWETYARERMSVDPDGSDNFNVERDGDIVYLNFTIDNEMPDPDDVGFGGGVLYSGTSDMAYKYHDGDNVHGAFEEEFEEDPETGPPIKPTLNTSEFNTSLDVHKQYEFALYNESGRWLIYNSSFGSDGRWEDYEGEPVDVSHTEALNSTRAGESTAVNHTNHEFFVDPPAWLTESGGAPVCVVTHRSGDVDITQNLTEGGECFKNMVGLNEDLVDPIPVSPEFNVSIDPSQPATNSKYKSGEEFPLEVKIANEGEIGGEIPLGVYLLNETNLNDENVTEAILANGTQAEDNYLDAGNWTTYNYTVELKDEWRMADDKHNRWMVFATTGTDTETLNTTSGDIDWFNVTERPSEFRIEDSTDAWFDVAAGGGDVKQGEYVEVKVRVNETKRQLSSNETQFVRLERNGILLNQTEVTRGPDAVWNGTVTMGWQINPDAPGEVTLNATTYDMDSPQQKTVTIEEDEADKPAFDVTGVTPDDPVEAGKTVEVNATIENVGDGAGDTIVELENDNTGELLAFGETGEINAGADSTVTLEWETETDAHEDSPIDVVARADGNESEGKVEVLEPTATAPTFEIDIVSTTDPAAVGEDTLEVTANVTNTGDESDTQWVYLDLENFDAGETGYTEVQLDPGEYNDTVTLEWEPEPGDADQAEIIAKTDDDQATKEVEVLSPEDTAADFSVQFKKDEDNSWNSTNDQYQTTAGETLTTEVTVQNEGDERGWQFVYLTDFNGTTIATKNITLDPDEQKDVTLKWDTSVTDGGNGILNVYSQDDDDNEDGEVQPIQTEDSNFVVEFQEDSYGVTEGDTLDMNVTVTNTGSAADEQIIYLEDEDGNLLDTVRVGELAESESQTVPLTWDTSVGDSPDTNPQTLTVASDDDDDTADVDVFEAVADRSDFQVEILETNSAVVEGEELIVDIRITNDGASSDTQDIVLENFDGGPVDTQTVSLDAQGGADDSKVIELSWPTIVGNADTGQIRVVSADDSDNTSATIEPKEQELRDPVDVMFVLDETGSMGTYNHVGELSVWDDKIFEPDISIGSTTRSHSGDFHHQVIEAQQSWRGDLLLKAFNREDGFDSDGKVRLYERDGSGWNLMREVNISAGQIEVSLESITFQDGEDYAVGHTSGEYAYPYDRDPSGTYFDVVDSAESLNGSDPYSWTYGFSEIIANEDSENGQDLYPVQDNKVVVFEDSPCDAACQANNYGQSEWFIPGETISADDWDSSTYERISIKEVADESSYFQDCDNSGCYDPYGDRIKAAQAALSGLNKTLGDRAGALEFDTSANTYQEITNNLTEVNESLRISPAGDTDIALGIEEAENELDDSDIGNDQVMIVLTDGKDNKGGDPVDQAEEVSEGIPIYTVGFGGADIDTLQEISEGGSGKGEQYFASETDELTDIFEEIVNEVTKPDVPAFSIEAVAPDDHVTEGNPLNVTVTLENEGDADGERFVTLKANGTVVDSESLYIAEGNTGSTNLIWNTSGGDFGETDITVVTQNESRTESVTIEERDASASDFQVEITDEPPAEVSAGDTVEIEAEITNEEPVEDQQEIALYVDGDEVVDIEETTTLGDGDTDTVILNWTPGASAEGERTLTVASADDEATKDIVVNTDGSSLPEFTVDIQDSAPTVTEGEELTLDVEVTNDGEEPSTQDIYLFNADEDAIVDIFEVTDLDPGQTRSIDLSWQTQVGQGDTTKTLEAQSNANSDAVDATVEEFDQDEAVFDVTINEPDEVTVVEGDEATVNVTVNNTGDAMGTQDVNLYDSSGTIFDSVTVEGLDVGEERDIQLSWQTESGDGGIEKDFEAASEDDEDDVTVVVEADTADSQFDVSIDESASDDETDAGDELTIEAEITNDGDDQDEQNVLLRDFNNSVVGIQSVNLTADESKNITLTWDTDEDDVGGPDDVTVESDDDDDTTEVEVTDNGTVAYKVLINNGANDGTVEAGDTFSPTVEVKTNVSVSGSDELVWLEIEDQEGNTTAQAYKEVDIPANGTKEVALEWEPDETDVGEYTFNVSTNDDMDPDNNLTVEPQTTPLEIQSVEPVTEPITAGEEVQVQVEIENTESDPVSDAIVELKHREIDYVVNIDFNVTIDPGATKTVTFDYDTFIGTGDDENVQTLKARIANTEESKTGKLQVDEADSNVNDPSMEAPTNPLDIDLDEIEIGT